jgi:hypothetical protein
MYDDNFLGLKNLKGFGVIDFVTFPHYKKRMKKEILSFKKLVGYKIITLNDRQAISVVDRKIFIV